MNWNGYLYTNNLSHHKVRQIKWKLRCGVGLDVCFLAYRKGSKNIAEIIPSFVLKQKYYPHRDLVIFGIGRTNQEAKILMNRFIQDMYTATGGFDTGAYLKALNKDGEIRT